MEKVSNKLAALVASSDPQTEVNLHVMLRKGLEGVRTQAKVDGLEAMATDKAQVNPGYV